MSHTDTTAHPASTAHSAGTAYRAGTDPVYVGRVRVDPSVANGLCLWVVADNLRNAGDTWSPWQSPTAGLLWEVVRHVLVWYFSTLSVVSLVYGSLATAIVFLLSLEIAGLILLFGAQVIAEYERFTLESRPEAGEIQN